MQKNFFLTIFLIIIFLIIPLSSQAFNVLIVPGHDNEFSGAAFKKMREADMTLTLAYVIAKKLRKIPEMKVTVARNSNGNYNKALTEYFIKDPKAISDFISEKKEESQIVKQNESLQIAKPSVPHANANTKVAYKLFAINKWANEQDFDIVLHIHFNDNYPRKNNVRGAYSGYTIYRPGSGFHNEKVSEDFAEKIGKEMGLVMNPSTMPFESMNANRNGVVADNKLIALGVHGTSSIPTVLVEYGYIYESLFGGKNQKSIFNTFADKTVSGIIEYKKSLVLKK